MFKKTGLAKFVDQTLTTLRSQEFITLPTSETVVVKFLVGDVTARHRAPWQRSAHVRFRSLYFLVAVW